MYYNAKTERTITIIERYWKLRSVLNRFNFIVSQGHSKPFHSMKNSHFCTELSTQYFKHVENFLLYKFSLFR